MQKASKDDIAEIQIHEQSLESKQKYRKIIQAATAKWVKKFQDGDIKVDTVEDLRTLIQIDLELQRSIVLDQIRIRQDKD